LVLSTKQQPQYGQGTPNPIEEQTRSLSRKYTQAQIDYFVEVALGSEFGDSHTTIKKWDKDVRIKVLGSPTQQDAKMLRTVINEINSITDGVHLQLNSQNPNVTIYFVSESNFRKYEANYSPINLGFFWDLWKENNIIYNSKILISIDGVTQTERSHLIREELTQSLGLMKDSYRYKDSVFYQGWTSVTQYADIDKALIEMLYRPEIRPGMTKSQVLQVLRTLDAKKESVPQCEPTDVNPALDFSIESCQPQQ
jgi:hypothetical protein